MRGPTNPRVEELWAAFGFTSRGSTWVIDNGDESFGGVQWFSIPAFRGYDHRPEGVIEAARAAGMAVEVAAEHDPERLVDPPPDRHANVWEMLARCSRPDDLILEDRAAARGASFCLVAANW